MQDARSARDTYCFGPFVLDGARFELRRNGRKLALQRKLFDLLGYLIEHRERVVSGRELLEQVWPDAAVEPVAVTRSICLLRKVLASEPGAGAWISTLRGRGYRFVAPLDVAGSNPPSGAGIPRARERSHSDSADAGARQDALFARPALAVLPFETLGLEPGRAHWGTALADDLITRLGRARLLPVVARASVLGAARAASTPAAAAAALGARYVVEGALTRSSARRVRASFRLLDATTGLVLWSDWHDCRPSDLLALQDEVAWTLAGRLAARLWVSELDRVERGPQPEPDLDAWDLTMSAWSRYWRRDAASLERACTLFTEALARPRAPALAWAGLALARSEQAATTAQPSLLATLQDGLVLLERARELDPSCATAHAVTGLLLTHRGECERALPFLDRAIALNPSEAAAHASRSLSLYRIGRMDDARRAIGRALKLSPQDPALGSYLYWAALCRVHDDRFEEGLVWLARCRSVEPRLGQALVLSAVCYGHLGRRDCAQALRLELEQGFSAEERRMLCERRRVESTTWPTHVRARFELGLARAGWDDWTRAGERPQLSALRSA